MKRCEMHCEQGWLPTDGQEDALLVTHEMAIDAGTPELEGQTYALLLIPTDYTACICNPLHSINPDLNIDPLDLEGAY
jgi:hypothetical protein